MGTAVLAVAATVSCGTGIRDGQGDLYATKTIGPKGDQIRLREATLDVWPDCLAVPTRIVLRRFPTIDHLGAVGPVFEIEIPFPESFQKDPRIGISTSSTVMDNPASRIGFLVPDVPDEQWVPDSNPVTMPCSKLSVCGPVQIQSFTNPGGTATLPQTRKLQFAIITKCQSPAECPLYQTCTSGACQACATSGPCNYPPP